MRVRDYVRIIALVFAAAGIRAAVSPWLEDKATLLVFPATVTVAAWMCGFAGGLFATGLSVAIATWVFTPAGFPHGLTAPGEVTRAWLFVGQGLLITAITGALVESRRALQQAVSDERRAREAVTTAIQQRDHLLAIASHELRTPLNVILGWSSQLTRTHLSPQQRRAVEAIHRNALAEARVVEDLLDAATAFAGELVLEHAALDLLAVARDVVDAMAPAAERKGVHLVANLEDRSRYLVGDERRLRQALFKVVENAVKFTPGGGSVWLRTRTIDHTLEIEIEDSGVGIPRELLPHVFDPFKHQHFPGRREHGGLGVSLSIVKDIVDRHGGTVTAESAGVGQGAMFRFTFPVVLRAVTPAPEPLRGVVWARGH